MQSELLYFRFKYFLKPCVCKVLPSIKDSTILHTPLTTYVNKRQNAIYRWSKLLLGDAGHIFWGRLTWKLKMPINMTNILTRGQELPRLYEGNSNREHSGRDYLKYFGVWGDKQPRFICEHHEQTQHVGKDVCAGSQHYRAILLKHFSSANV
jgi:hypothetical protein